jgi:hypothetical protein
VTPSDRRADPDAPAGTARVSVAIGWAAATLLGGAACLFPVIVQRAPALGGAGYSPGDSITAVAITRLDVWGVCAVLLAAAALSTAFPGRFGPSWLLELGAPVAGGALAGIAAAQLLAFQATARSSAEAGADVVTAVPRPQWQLGPSPWLLTAGALVAVITGVLARRDQSAEPAIRPRAADGPGPPQLPGRPDALPATRSLPRRAC